MRVLFQKKKKKKEASIGIYNSEGLGLSLQGERIAADGAGDQLATPSDSEQDLFESTYKELRKWVDVKSSKYGTITVIRERRSGRLGSALKVCLVTNSSANIIRIIC